MSPLIVSAETIPAITILDGQGTENTYSVSLQIIALMTALTLLPALVLAMTSFTRIIIVFGILRQAMGMPQTPSNQILLGLALFLTFFIMAPVYNEVNRVAISPYMAGDMEIKEALDHAIVPIKVFMTSQTRQNDLAMFAEYPIMESHLNKMKVNLLILTMSPFPF